MESLLDHLIILYEAKLAEFEVNFDTATEAGMKHSRDALSAFFFELQEAIVHPNIFFEIGAFSATTSLALKEALPDTQCFAFEASTYNYTFFQNKYDYEKAGVNYINAAVSRKPGKKKFYIQKSIDSQEVDKIRANNSLLERKQQGVEYEEHWVETYSVDSFVQSKNLSLDGTRISLWIDTEGAAFEVLQGIRSTLKYVQSILVEVEEKRYWKKQALAQRTIKYLLQAGFIPVARDFEAPFQYNILFVRPETIHRATYKTCRSTYLRSIRKHISAPTDAVNQTLP